MVYTASKAARVLHDATGAAPKACSIAMAELFVSLVRNGACVLKSLLPTHFWVMQPTITIPFAASANAEKFTGLEGFIGLLQLAGACFNLWKGLKVRADSEIPTLLASSGF